MPYGKQHKAIARSLSRCAETRSFESLRRQPATDVQLVRHIQQRSNNLLQVEEGSLYPTLHRLLKAKLARPALPRTCDDAEPVCGRTDRFGARVRRFPGGSSTKSNCRPGAAGLPILFLLTLL
jgi:hypothetical protein